MGKSGRRVDGKTRGLLSPALSSNYRWRRGRWSVWCFVGQRSIWRRKKIMATPELRLPENVPGVFYVTSECIDCDICRETAPGIYRRHDEIGYSIVHHQPVTTEERA
jgi:ferredoxin